MIQTILICSAIELAILLFVHALAKRRRRRLQLAKRQEVVDFMRLRHTDENYADSTEIMHEW